MHNGTCERCGLSGVIETLAPIFEDPLWTRGRTITLLDGVVLCRCEICGADNGTGYPSAVDLAAVAREHPDCDVFRYLPEERRWVAVESRAPSIPDGGTVVWAFIDLRCPRCGADANLKSWPSYRAALGLALDLGWDVARMMEVPPNFRSSPRAPFPLRALCPKCMEPSDRSARRRCSGRSLASDDGPRPARKSGPLSRERVGTVRRMVRRARVRVFG